MSGLFPKRLKSRPVDTGTFRCRSCNQWMPAVMRCSTQGGCVCFACHTANAHKRKDQRAAGAEVTA